MIEILGKQLDWHSASLSDFPALGDDEIHLWHLPLTLSSQQSELALGWLSDIQRDKYHRRSSQALKHNYLAGRYFLLQLLAAYSNSQPWDIKLSYSRLNKPSLSKSSMDLQFNFTDTSQGGRNFGLFAFSAARAVGVDIESRAREIDFKDIVDKRFTSAEQKYVSENKKLNLQRCLAIWTRKEAYGKAIGKGINFKMNQRNLLHSNKSDSPEFNFEGEEQTLWRCLQIELADNFIASLVHEGHQDLPVKAFNYFET